MQEKVEGTKVHKGWLMVAILHALAASAWFMAFLTHTQKAALP